MRRAGCQGWTQRLDNRAGHYSWTTGLDNEWIVTCFWDSQSFFLCHPMWHRVCVCGGGGGRRDSSKEINITSTWQLETHVLVSWEWNKNHSSGAQNSVLQGIWNRLVTGSSYAAGHQPQNEKTNSQCLQMDYELSKYLGVLKHSCNWLKGYH